LRGNPHGSPDTLSLRELLVVACEIRTEDRAWNAVISLGFEI
jgi:hypothetical protein